MVSTAGTHLDQTVENAHQINKCNGMIKLNILFEISLSSFEPTVTIKYTFFTPGTQQRDIRTGSHQDHQAGSWWVKRSTELTGA